MQAGRYGRRITVRAPAKVNLFLAVRGRRRDGYHDIVSVLQSVTLHDHLSVAIDSPPAKEQHPASRRRMRLHLDVDGPHSVPTDDGNLVLKAAVLLGERMGLVDPDHYSQPVRTGWSPVTAIRLDKSIPVAGGMAGGSSDAAATLVALNTLWNCGLGGDDLLGLAAELGSDVPFCLRGGTALATGRGTRLARVLCRGTFHWVIGATPQPLPTADVYRAWDAEPRTSLMEPDAVLAALSAGDAEALGGALANDLEQPALTLLPDLAQRRKAMLDAGALGALISGSGPTVLGLASHAHDAERIAAEVAEQFDRVHVATSPAGGPEVTR